jgi:hypothetical protein
MANTKDPTLIRAADIGAETIYTFQHGPLITLWAALLSEQFYFVDGQS